jgi:hypothetical protein
LKINGGATGSGSRRGKKRLLPVTRKEWMLEAVKLSGLWLLLSPLVAAPLYRWMVMHPDRTDYSYAMANPLKLMKEHMKVSSQDVWFKTPHGERLHGLFLTKEGARKTVIVFHGNAGNIAHRLVLGTALTLCHANVLLFDYEGFGKSEGEATLPGIVTDGLAAYDYAVRERKLSSSDIVLYGESLGCAVATQVSEQRKTAGVILQSPFSSLIEAGRERLVWLYTYPDSWFQDLNMNNTVAFRHKHVPLLLIHGTADEILNKHHSEEIFAQAVEPKKLVILEGFGHSVESIGAKPYVVAVTNFMHALDTVKAGN